MSDLPTDTQARFLQRIERRARFLKNLQDAGLGVYLPTDDQQRKRTIELLVRMTARHSELPTLTAETLNRAFDTMRNHLEAMQQVLPHDVQYRNRIRRDW